jgi:hypothetical protein
MWPIIKKAIHDGVTCLDGETYDPLKLIGYPSFLMALLVYLAGGIASLMAGKFDFVAFGGGFTALAGGLLAIAAGVAVKSKTEPGAKT